MPRSIDAIKTEIATLERLQRKRSGKLGYGANVAEIGGKLEAARTELAEAEAANG